MIFMMSSTLQLPAVPTV